MGLIKIIGGLAASWLPKWKLYAVIAAMLAIAAGALVIKGMSIAKNKAYIETLQSVVEDFNRWDKAHVEAEMLSDIERCVRLGGVRRDCERQLRGEETATGE